VREWVKPDLLVVDDLFLARRITAEAAEVLLRISANVTGHFGAS
jgi:predicted molibdopterin-dependent oxidoreductase YjgC